MIRLFLNKLLHRKNPDFKFDPSISDVVLLQLAWIKGWALFRALRLLLFGVWPKWVFFERGVKLFHPTNIRFGRWVQLEQNVYVSALGKSPLCFGNNVRVGAHSRVIISTTFSDPGAFIHIGNNVGIGEFAYLGGAGGLKIGDDCIIGQYFSCHPENHNFGKDDLIRNQGISRRGIHVGRNCWIGAKVTLLDGVHIGDNCVIAAGAVVTKSMPSDVVIGGVPAKILKYIHSNKDTYEDHSGISIRSQSQ